MHLVEIKPGLARAAGEDARERRRLDPWHDTIEEVPDGPAIVIANEFVDALPVHQFVKDRDGWHPRMIGIVDGKLAFMAAPGVLFGYPGAEPPWAPYWSGARTSQLRCCRAASRHGGAALIIDYGHAESGFGDTLQAVRAHKFADPLADAGEADLTAQVDFGELAVGAAARRNYLGPSRKALSCAPSGLSGAPSACNRRQRRSRPPISTSASMRLTAPDQMGELFKVMAIAHPKLGTLLGFDS